MMKFNKFNKIKEVITEILEKSTKEKTTYEILEKDIKVIFSYVKFSLEKRIESLMVGLNKNQDEKIAEIEMDHADLIDLRFSLKVIFADISYDLLMDNKNGSEKSEIVNDFKCDIDTLIIKMLNRLSPMHLVKENYLMAENEKDKLKFG